MQQSFRNGKALETEHLAANGTKAQAETDPLSPGGFLKQPNNGYGAADTRAEVPHCYSPINVCR